MPLIALSSNFTKLQNQAFSATNLHGNKAKAIQNPNHWHFGQTPSKAIEVSLTL